MPERESSKHSDWVILGKIAGPHGIKGWVKIISYCSPRDNILSYVSWSLLQDEKGPVVRELTLNNSKEAGGRLTASFKGVDDRNAAEALQNLFVAIPAEVLPSLTSDEFYWRDLEGLEVRDLQGAVFGRVAHLIETGSNDVLVVKPNSESIDGRERLVPFLMDQVVKDGDLVLGTVVIDWDSCF